MKMLSVFLCAMVFVLGVGMARVGLIDFYDLETPGAGYTFISNQSSDGFIIENVESPASIAFGYCCI